MVSLIERFCCTDYVHVTCVDMQGCNCEVSDLKRGTIRFDSLAVVQSPGLLLSQSGLHVHGLVSVPGCEASSSISCAPVRLTYHISHPSHLSPITLVLCAQSSRPSCLTCQPRTLPPPCSGLQLRPATIPPPLVGERRGKEQAR